MEMTLQRLAATAVLGLSLAMPLTAGDLISEALVEKAQKSTEAITPKELKKLIDDETEFVALDVREADMRMEGTFDAEKNIAIARGVLEFDVGAKIPDKKALVVVYCRVGKSAVLAAQTMKQELGYSNVRYLQGGLDAWMEEGYSIYNHFGEVKLAK